MSKLKNLLLVAMVFLFLPMLAACNDDTPEYNIDTWVYVSSVVLDNESKSIPLVRNTSYQLKYSFEPIEATNKTVEFSSSNPNVATVDKTGKVTAVGSGSCTITVKSLDNKNALTDSAVVTVVNEKEKLAKPTNARFDGTRLSWNAITVKSSTSFVPQYELTITCDDGEPETVVTTANYYSDFAYGEYSVVLRALGDSENVLYDNSDATSEYVFVKRGAPTDLNVTATGDVETDAPREYVLSFTLANNSTSLDDYEYKITPVSGSLTIPNSQKEIWDIAISQGTVEQVGDKYVAKIAIPTTIANDPVYIVFGTKTDATQNIYGSGFENADRVQVGRLAAPSNLLVSAVSDATGIKNLLTWSSVPSADRYRLKVVYKDADQHEISTIIAVFDAWGVISYDLGKLEGVPSNYDSYEVYLYALGTSETSLVLMDSDSSICAKQQLSSVQGEIAISSDNESTYTITWNKVTNAQGYKIYLSDNSLDYLTEKDLTKCYNTTTTSFSFGFNTQNANGESIWNIGDNYIKIVAVAEPNSTFEDSAIRKASQKLVKLKTPDLKVSKGALVWDAVSGAEVYTISFGNGKTYTVDAEFGKQSYTYEPTREDFNYSSYCDASIYATNSSTFYIESQASTRMRLNRYNKIAQSSLSIVDGNLTWGGLSGMLDENGSVINTNSVEIKVLKTADNSELKTIASSSSSLSIAEVLDGLDGDGFYSFSLRPVSTNSAGTTDINGDWSDVIKTYQMDAPKNLRLSDGVLCWDKMIDENVGVENAGIRYVIKLNNSELSTNLRINDVSTVLQNLTSGINYTVSIQTKITGTENIKVIDDDDTYLINSLFSDAINVRLTPRPVNLSVEDYTLSWTSSGSSVSSYKISLYKSGSSTPLAVEENVSPRDTLNPSYDFSTSSFGNVLVLAGNYEFVVQALGDSTVNLSSYASDGLEICKLATPKITVSDNGKLSWTSSQVKLDNLTETLNKFMLTVRNADGVQKTVHLDTTSTDLGFLTDESLWCGEDNTLTITIKALDGGRRRVYESGTAVYTMNTDDTFGSTVLVYKLPQVDPELISINEDTQQIQWTAGEYTQSQCYYNLIICQKTDLNKEQTLVNTTVQADATGKASYNISTSWFGANYYVKVQQIGFATKTSQAGVGEEITRRLTSEYSEAKFFTRLCEATGMYLSSSDGAPVLNWQVLQESESSRYRVTLQKLDASGAILRANQIVYHVDYDATQRTKYSLNLYTALGYNEINGGLTSLTDLVDDDGNYAGEFQVYVTVVPKLSADGTPETSVTVDGKDYLLMSSRVSKIQTMTIYAAPTISVKDSSVEVVNSNSSSRGVKLEFQEVILAGTEYSPTGSVLSVELSASKTYYEVTKAQLLPNKIYQVTTQAIGNGSNLVSSQKVVSDVLVTKLAALEPNTTTATFSGSSVTNISAFDGWYVKSGKIQWNNVTGAAGYKIYMTSGSTAKMVLDRDADADDYSEVLSDMGFGSNFGAFTLQFQVKGGDIVETEYTLGAKPVSLGYLSSDLATGTVVNKLFTPNGTYSNSPLSYTDKLPDGNIYLTRNYDRTLAHARIDENGEFDFGVRDGGGDWIDTGGATKYLLSIQGLGSNQEVYPDIEYDLSLHGDQNHFVASEYFGTESGTFMVSMYSVGNDWYGDATQPIYLTSDVQNSFKILYAGAIQDLGVTSGNVTWVDPISLNNYDLKYKVSGASTFDAVTLSQNIFAFDGEDWESLKGLVIDEIYVRVKGIPTTEASAIEGYVNTAWNLTPLTKVMKLPDLGTKVMGAGDDAEEMILYIDERGRLAWLQGTELAELQVENDTAFSLNIAREVRVGQEIIQPKASEIVALSDQVYTVPRVIEAGSSGVDRVYIYYIDAYVRGSGTTGTIYASDTRYNDSDAALLFLNGTEFSFSAGKLNNPADDSFALDKLNGKVRISWDLDGCSISIVDDQNVEQLLEADQIMLTYYLDNDMNNMITRIIKASDYKFASQTGTSQKGGTAFWQLATFRDMKLSVLNSKGKAFGSESIALDTATVEFRYFESGTGSRDDPFVITTVEQLSAMYWLPEKYFRLGDDIILPDLSELQQTEGYLAARTNIPYPKEFYDITSGASTEYTNRIFHGGFDGAGYSIRNYQVIGASSMSIWNSVIGTTLEPLVLADGEYDDTVYRDYGGIITNLTVEVNTIDASSLRNLYNGVIAGVNSGIIYNCHIRGDDAKTNELGNRIAVVEGEFSAPATINGSQANYYIGSIAGMVSDQKDFEDVLNYGSDNPIYLYAQGFVGRVENCTNLLDLKINNSSGNTSVFVGGMVGLNSNGRIVNCVNGSSVIESGKNSGDISGYYAGGIAGANIGVAFNKSAENETGYTSMQYYSYIYGCKNFATISTRVMYDENNQSASVAGGISGIMSFAYATYVINYGVVTTDGAAAFLGGISGLTGSGTYIASALNAGKIQYNRYYTADVATQVFAGAVCAYVQNTSVLYDLAINSGCIVCINSDGSTTASSDYWYSGSGTGNILSDKLYTSLNMDNETLDNLQSQAAINSSTILVANSSITISYANLDGLYPRFTLGTNGEKAEWTFNWTTEHAD